MQYLWHPVGCLDARPLAVRARRGQRLCVMLCCVALLFVLQEEIGTWAVIPPPPPAATEFAALWKSLNVSIREEEGPIISETLQTGTHTLRVGTGLKWLCNYIVICKWIKKTD